MQGLAAILRDARKDALLQRQRRSRCAGMRSGIYFTTSQDEVLQSLMVRSAATPRVSNHEARGTRYDLPNLKCFRR